MKKDLKAKSIKIAESDYQKLRQGSKDRCLCMGEYLMSLYNAEQHKQLRPDVMCKLIDIGVLLKTPPEEWDETMQIQYRKDVESIWSLLNG